MFANNPVAQSMVINLDEVRREMLGRIRLEALEAGNDPFLREVAEEVRASLSGRPWTADDIVIGDWRRE
jgi:hypothetical protein